MDNNIVFFPVPLDELEGLIRKVVREEAKGSRSEAENRSEILLDRSQLSEKLGITPKTLSSWVKRGKIPFVKVGSVDRFDWLQVRSALEKQGKRK